MREKGVRGEGGWMREEGCGRWGEGAGLREEG